MVLAKLHLDVQCWTVIYKDPDENDASGFVVFGDYDDAVAALREDAIEDWDGYHEPSEPDPRTWSVDTLLEAGYGYQVWHIVEATCFGRAPHIKDGGGP